MLVPSYGGTVGLKEGSKMNLEISSSNVDFYNLVSSNMFEPVLYKSEFQIYGNPTIC
jgi:hypothetical protein